MRIFIASLNVVGLVLRVEVGRTSFALGPGGGWIDVLKIGLGAIVGAKKDVMEMLRGKFGEEMCVNWRSERRG
jgi:hypothetical protein